MVTAVIPSASAIEADNVEFNTVAPAIITVPVSLTLITALVAALVMLSPNPSKSV